MADLGIIALLAALVLSAYGAVAAVVGHRRGIAGLRLSSQRAVWATAALVTLAVAALVYAFATRDFSIRYVAERSSRSMSLPLTIAAFYSGQAGSLLYWAWTLALFTAVVIWRGRHRLPNLVPYVTATLLGIQAFLLFILGFVTTPFEQLPFTPADGLGLNPLLNDGGMLLHPPLLLAGYASWSIPFAFAMAALLTGRLDGEWVRATRRYALIAWMILGLGNLVGAWWAYHVLGWGGYWGWDPVENASFLPWLTGTAYLHSVMIQERRGMLKIWNLALIILTFNLAIFGTFIVRSGVISSVHAFSQSAVGPYYLGFLAFTLLSALGLLTYRLPRLRAENQIDSFLSREAFFLLNNVVFLGIAFATLWGSIYPLISEVVSGVKVTVGPPYYNQVNGPLFVVLIALMGIAPLTPWRRASRARLVASFAGPATLALVVAVGGVVAGLQKPPALVGVAVCAFVVGTIVMEFARGVRTRWRAGCDLLGATVGLVRANPRRYGGYLIHLGVVLIALAVVGSRFYQTERDVTLAPGEELRIGPYQVTFLGLSEEVVPGQRIVVAPLAVREGGRYLGEVSAEKAYHRNYENQPSTRVGLLSGPRDDLYVVLTGWDETGRAGFVVFVNPLVMWLWIGGALLLAGALVAVAPAAWEQHVPAARRVAGVVRSVG
ncbi:MAG: heme lyase CcmF/NrfE family subunit [Chloroflexi bacterium]|nr:heme lyase CcmF/NrfE family subunit [Chloroflexota bacterium]